MRACYHCKQQRSWRTYSVFVLAPLISVILWLYPLSQLGYWIGLPVLTYFGIVMVIDLEHRLILHIVSFAGMIIGLLAGVIAHGWTTTLAGGLAGLLIMFVLYQFGTLFARYRARKLGVDDDEEALGFGDVFLSGVIGLMLGWPQITRGLIIAILAGGVISLLIIVVLSAARRYQSMNVFTAYAPYLIIGAILVLFSP
jgi:leader peptidase (prepilin peptidase)/N-methyltransferase